MAARERIAHGEIYVEVNDEQLRQDFKQIERDFDRMMRDISHEEASAKIDGDLAPLEDKLAGAKRKLKAAEGQKATIKVGGNTKEVDRVIRNVKREIKRLEGRKAVVEMQVKGDEKVRKAIEATRKAEEKRVKAFEDAEARRERARAASQRREVADERRRAAAVAAESRRNAALNRQREQEMASAHAWAARMNRDYDLRADKQRKEASVTAKLQRRYADMQTKVQQYERDLRKVRVLASTDLTQKIDLKRREVVEDMAVIKAELAAMGRVPIAQKVALSVDERGVGMLGRWVSAITETTVRVGPFTTTIAGLTKALLLLGPAIVGIVGHLGSLAAALGAGLLGGAGIGAGALAAFGVSLGGVAMLLPSMLRNFKHLNALQDAYRKRWLELGPDAEKTQTALEKYKHALGAVDETTFKAFMTFDKLQDRFRKMRKEARPDFYNALGQSITTVNHHFDFFRDNTLDAFHQVSEGWQAWMRGLRSSEADRILHNLGQAGNESLPPLMRGLGNLGTAFGRVAESFSKVLPDIMRGFELWTQHVSGAVSDTEKLDGRTERLVDSLKAAGHFTAALGRFIVALFAPGVDVGTKSLDRYADGLNNTALAMRTTKRSGLVEFYERATVTAEKFWGATKPFAQMFFEWTTIMRPFTNLALDTLRIIGNIMQAVMDFAPTRAALLTVFGVALWVGIARRIVAAASGLWSIARAIGAIKAAGGIGAALKAAAMRGATGGLLGAGGRGLTPATPIFVKDVGLPGRGPGGPVGPAGRGPGGVVGGLGNLSKFAKIGGGITIAATAFVALTKAIDSLEQKKATKAVTKDLQEMIATRNIEGIRALTRDMEKYGQGLDSVRKPAKDALRAVQDFENKVANSSIVSNFRNIQRGGSATFRQIKDVVGMNMRTIADRMDTKSAEGKAAVAKNFRLAASAVRQRMRETGQVTKAGMELVDKYMMKALEAMGLTKAQAQAKVKTGTLKNSEDRPGAATLARGGVVQVGRKGERGADTVPMNLGGVPAVVAPGEQIAVFNAHQQKKFAKVHPGGLEGFFSGPQRRHNYAGGGIVPVPGFPGERAASSVIGKILQVAKTYGLVLTDAYGQGHKSPGHTVTGTAADFAGPDAAMTRAAHALAAAGYVVGYDGTGGTMNWPGHGPSTVAGNNAHLHVEFASGSGGIPGIEFPEIPPVYTDMNGVPGVVANQAIAIVRDTAQATAQRVADDLLASPVAGGGGAAMGDDALMGVIRQALQRTGHYSSANASALFRRVMQESGGNPGAQNNWDINAKNGDPSIGLAQMIDSTFQQYRDKALPNDRRHPLANLVAAINYMIARYGRIVDANGQGYAQGGIAVDKTASKMGGKVSSPRLLVGEEPHGESVISHNPAYRGRNIGLLRSAAAALGVPMARKGKDFKKPRLVEGAGRDVDKLEPVERYRRIQTREQDKNREISIAESRIKEPETFIKKTGTDKDGEPLYSVDQTVIDNYKKQMQGVMDLYGDLIGGPAKGKGGLGGIMGQLKEAAQEAFARISTFVANRNSNIAALQSTIGINQRLLKSKDKDVRNKAKNRIESAKEMVAGQRDKISEAGTVRDDIRSDQHDARFREQEYGISRDNVGHDIAAVGKRADEEAASANPEAAGPTGENPAIAALTERGAMLDAEMALAQIGQGLNGGSPRSEQDILNDQAKVQQGMINEARAMLSDMDKSNDSDAYSILSSAAGALQSINSELAKFDPLTNAKLLATASKDALREFGDNFVTNAVGASMRAGQAVGKAYMGGALGMPTSFGAPQPGKPQDTPTMTPGRPIVNLNATFANVPPDPHAWSKQVAFELAVM